MTHLAIAPQFDDAAQQHESAALGMWAFLATEVLFFGGLLTVYTVYRMAHPAAFAEASSHLYTWIGAVNTVVLLLSSWTMALAVHAGAHGERARIIRMLAATMALGLAFLLLKAVEYYLDFHDHLVPGRAFRPDWSTNAPAAQMFFILYFILTGMHAAHMLVGVLVVACFVAVIRTTPSPARHANALELVGLYWHFVDIVWIFLFPLLYLVA